MQKDDTGNSPVDLVEPPEWRSAYQSSWNYSDRRFGPSAGGDFSRHVKYLGEDARVNHELIPPTTIRRSEPGYTLTEADHIRMRAGYENGTLTVTVFQDVVIWGGHLLAVLIDAGYLEIRVQREEIDPFLSV